MNAQVTGVPEGIQAGIYTHLVYTEYIVVCVVRPQYRTIVLLYSSMNKESVR